MPDRLQIQNFAQIEEVDLTFGDLTVLVGAQATGKSLALQWLKVALDGRQLVKALREAGHPTHDPETLIDLIFGSGMGSAWVAESAVKFDRKTVGPEVIHRLGDHHDRAFVAPAHRSMLISDGWAAPFQKLSSETPVVARIFSQTLYDQFTAKDAGPLFPLEHKLKQVYREQIDKAIFHSGEIGIEEDRQHAKRLRLTHGGQRLPFMVWTAGQREFTPLLIGLYHLLPSRSINKHKEIEWVIIEEPEMGLHPQGIVVCLTLVLELLSRGYRVVLSTHSPVVCTAVWALQQLKELGADWKRVCAAFGLPESPQLKNVARAALTKDYRVFHLRYTDEGNKVRSVDISALDPDSDDESVSGWGGLIGFSDRFAETVREVVNEQETR